MAAQEEAAKPLLVFNGDFHWFDVDPASFSEINVRALAHFALRGNVETKSMDRRETPVADAPTRRNR